MEEVAEVALEAAAGARSTTSRRLPRPPRAPGRPCTSRSPPTPWARGAVWRAAGPWRLRAPRWRGWWSSCGGASSSAGPLGSATGRGTSISPAWRGATGCASAPSSPSTNAAPGRMTHSVDVGVKLSRWSCSMLTQGEGRKQLIESSHRSKSCVMTAESWRWVPLPQWVLEEMDKMPDLSYTDRYQRRNKEYISLGCDILPLLKADHLCKLIRTS